MVQRVTYRRRLSYNTKSNRRKIVRTPGGKLVFQYLKKRPNVPKCPMTGIRLKGVKPMRPSEKSRHSLRQKKVYRAYGGMLNPKLLTDVNVFLDRIPKGILIEMLYEAMKPLFKGTVHSYSVENETDLMLELLELSLFPHIPMFLWPIAAITVL